MTRAWIFDLDDTLYLERDYVLSGFRAVDNWAQSSINISGFLPIAWDLFLSGVRGTTITRAFETLGRPLTVPETTTAVNIYRSHEPDIKLCPDASDLLDRLSQSGDRVGIITDGPAASQRAKLRALKLDCRGYTTVITDDYGATWHKPNTLAFEHVQAKIGLEPRCFTYIADNPLKDFTAPRLLGWKTIRVVRSLGLYASLPCSSTVAARSVGSLTEINDDMEENDHS